MLDKSSRPLQEGASLIALGSLILLSPCNDALTCYKKVKLTVRLKYKIKIYALRLSKPGDN